MEPSTRQFDLVVYANTSYTIGDIVVYCPTFSHCYAHRVVGYMQLDTVNGGVVKVITKGDNTNDTDSPVDIAWIRGRVVLVVPREIWVPFVIALLAYSKYYLAKFPIIGLSHVILLAVGLVSIVSVYVVLPQPVISVNTRVYAVHLGGIYFDPSTCTVAVRYVTELSLSSVSARVGGVPAEIVTLRDAEIQLKSNLQLLGEVFENGTPLRIEVSAVLNHAARLYGEYELPVSGVNPEITSLNGVLVVRNHNCFPLRVHVSLRYYDGEWKWSNTTYVIEGFSYLVVEPPAGVKHVYAYIHWFNQGEKNWIGVPIKTG